MTSIRRRLLGWLVAGLCIATIAGAWAVFARARAEVRELFDYQMKLMVAAFPDEGFGGSRSRTGTDAIPGDVVVVQIWDRNGTRLYRFDDSGRIIPKPAGEYADLAPDTSTPVATGGRLFGAHGGLHCLDTRDGLRPVWRSDDEALGDYASLIADERRV